MTAAEGLLGCAEEPIRVPGAIQPHGVLLALAEPGLEVVMASANAAALLGREVSGARLDDLLDPGTVRAVRAGLEGDLAELGPLRVQLQGESADLVLHRADGLLVAEVEPLEGGVAADLDWHRRLPLVLQRLTAAESLQGLLDALAREVRALTGFDRVMVYRFDRDWNGEVVAEQRRDDLEPFLGLRYPASDIPPQARALYEANWLRLIPDAGYSPVALEPALTPGGVPLDLGGSVLRSVSPVHLEYLANMGVRSSMSVSLLDGGRLWGLVACHHYSGPHRPSCADRVTAEFLGRTTSLLLASKADTDAREAVLQVSLRESALVAALGRSPRTPAPALTDGDVTLLDLLPAGGAALRLDGRLTLLGSTPPPERVEQLVAALLATGEHTTESLVRIVPAADDVVRVASGVLAVEVGGRGEPGGGGRGSSDFLAWFRPETLQEVHWGGDPSTTKVVEDESGVRLSPRQSFAEWTEVVRATAAPWQPHEVAAAERLARHLGETMLLRAQEDSRLVGALQRALLLERLPEVPGVALAASYAPSARDVVGGDWYDLILLPNGNVSVVLGDVAGHGLGVAGTTAQVRHALRAYLLRAAGPARALRSLNDLVTTLLPGEMVTAVVAELDPVSGQVTVASAGHPPALLVAGASGSFLDGGRGPALGLLDEPDFAEASLWLSSDDRLVVYSDGLVERRDADLGVGLEALRSAAAAGSREPDRLLDGVLGSLSPSDGDDVTLVCIGLA